MDWPMWLMHYNDILLLPTMNRLVLHTEMGFQKVVLVVKNLPVNAADLRDKGSIAGWGRSPGQGNGNPLQYCGLENPMDRGAWRATVSMQACHTATKVLAEQIKCLVNFLLLPKPPLNSISFSHCYKSGTIRWIPQAWITFFFTPSYFWIESGKSISFTIKKYLSAFRSSFLSRCGWRKNLQASWRDKIQERGSSWFLSPMWTLELDLKVVTRAGNEWVKSY